MQQSAIWTRQRRRTGSKSEDEEGGPHSPRDPRPGSRSLTVKVGSRSQLPTSSLSIGKRPQPRHTQAYSNVPPIPRSGCPSLGSREGSGTPEIPARPHPRYSQKKGSGSAPAWRGARALGRRGTAESKRKTSPAVTRTPVLTKYARGSGKRQSEKAREREKRDRSKEREVTPLSRFSAVTVLFEAGLGRLGLHIYSRSIL